MKGYTTTTRKSIFSSFSIQKLFRKTTKVTAFQAPTKKDRSPILKAKSKSNKDVNDNKNDVQPSLLEYIDANVIGNDTVFDGPYGKKQVVYCDYTASGKPLQFIEDYIQSYVYPFYANTHTNTTTTSRQTTQFRNDARNIIKSCVNAQEDDVVIFTGSGTTGAIHKLIHALQLQKGQTNNTVVFVGPFEHHSNILPWKEAGAQVERINEDENGLISMSMLEDQLKKYSEANYTIYAAFSVASNVTGILTDTVAVAELCHMYGALSFWDYASGAPYLDINMNPTEKGYKDAVFLSPHKFVGGPGSPGVLISKRHVFKNPVPGGCGGGTVVFVTRETHLYVKDIESREEGGTPAIVESIRAGMVFQLKKSVGPKLIEQREEELCQKAFKVWDKNSCLTILGSHRARRLPIFSFIVYHNDSGKLLHHNFVSSLLNDLYGIQARGGCACAGPYAMDLLGLSEDLGKKYQWFLKERHEHVQLKDPLEIMKPGFARINLPCFMDDETVHFVLEAVDMVATYGWKLLPQYRFDARTGDWQHRNHPGTPSFSLHNITYDNNGMHVTHAAPSELLDCTLEDIARAAKKTFEMAPEVNKEIFTNDDELVSFPGEEENLVWFLQPQEAQIFLATDSLKFKVFKRTNLPFTPRKTSTNYSMTRMELQKRRTWSTKSYTIPNPEGDGNNVQRLPNAIPDNEDDEIMKLLTELNSCLK